jgi:Kef-type K+ transport system membrane component KefB
MFYLGLEFNFTKLGRIWSLSLFGSSLLLAITLLFSCTILPQFLHASMAESFVIGSSVFLSSTAVVVHFLKPGESETNYGRSIMVFKQLLIIEI